MKSSVIVVGIDGSDGSRRALRWALHEASLRGATVEVVTAWPSRDLVARMAIVDPDEAQRTAKAMQQQVIDEELAKLPNPPMLSFELVHGDPVEILLLASTTAEMLVVGSHNTSSLSHVMLGSVSEACARMAECPVVVLPMGTPIRHRSEIATAPGPR